MEINYDNEKVSIRDRGSRRRVDEWQQNFVGSKSWNKKVWIIKSYKGPGVPLIGDSYSRRRMNERQQNLSFMGSKRRDSEGSMVAMGAACGASGVVTFLGGGCMVVRGQHASIEVVSDVSPTRHCRPRLFTIDCLKAQVFSWSCARPAPTRTPPAPAFPRIFKYHNLKLRRQT